MSVLSFTCPLVIRYRGTQTDDHRIWTTWVPVATFIYQMQEISEDPLQGQDFFPDETQIIISISSPWWPGWVHSPPFCKSCDTYIHSDWLIGPASEVRGHCGCRVAAETENARIEVNFVIFGALTSWFFWSHYVLKQLIGRLLLCGIRHIVVNCLRNADCWKVSTPSGTWCELLFCKHRCQSHGEPTWSLGKPIDRSGKLYSQNALQLQNNFSCLFLVLLWSLLPLSDIQCFCLIFLFLFIYHSFHKWPNWFSTFCSEWSSFNGSKFSTEMIWAFFYLKKKILPGK